MRCERKSFNGCDVRYYWDDEMAEWRFSAVDVIGALALSAEPDVYWEIFIKRKDARIAKLVNELDKAEISAGIEEKVASADQLIKLAAFFPEERKKALAAFVSEVCTGFADIFSPVVVLEDGMLSADPSVDPSEETLWLTAEDVAALSGVSADDVIKAVERVFSEGLLAEEKCCHTVISEERQKVTFYSLSLVSALLLLLDGEKACRFRSRLSAIAEGYIIKGYACDKARLSSLGCSLEVRSSASAPLNGGDADAAYAFLLRGKIRAAERNESIKVHVNSYRISAEECSELVTYLDGSLSEAELTLLDRILEKVFEVDDEGMEVYESAEKKAAAFLWDLVKEEVVFPDELFIFFLHANGLIGERSVFFDGITLPLVRAAVSTAPKGSRIPLLDRVAELISLSA